MIPGCFTLGLGQLRPHPYPLLGTHGFRRRHPRTTLPTRPNLHRRQNSAQGSIGLFRVPFLRTTSRVRKRKVCLFPWLKGELPSVSLSAGPLATRGPNLKMRTSAVVGLDVYRIDFGSPGTPATDVPAFHNGGTNLGFGALPFHPSARDCAQKKPRGGTLPHV